MSAWTRVGKREERRKKIELRILSSFFSLKKA
jgi:hypothetical protein